AGQAAMGLYKIDTIGGQLRGKDLASAHVRLFVEKADDNLAAFAKREATERLRTSDVTVDVQNLDVQKGRAIVRDDFDVPSQVDEFWTKLRTKVIPAINKKRGAVNPVTVVARLSEPPEIRRQLE